VSPPLIMALRKENVFSDKIFAPSPIDLWERTAIEKADDHLSYSGEASRGHDSRPQGNVTPREMLAPTGPQTPASSACELPAPWLWTPSASEPAGSSPNVPWRKSTPPTPETVEKQAHSAPIPLGDATATRYLKVWSLPKQRLSPRQDGSSERQAEPKEQPMLKEDLEAESEQDTSDMQEDPARRLDFGIPTNMRVNTSWVVRGLGQEDYTQRSNVSSQLVTSMS
jgi:hypothetical protein